jgi:diguanylate cyclase (GGDEF)-like protein
VQGKDRDPLAFYRFLASLPSLARNYERKFAVAACIGTLGPVVFFAVYLFASYSDPRPLYPIIAALALACIVGLLGALWLIRELLAPIALTGKALRDYIETRRMPDLPIEFHDEAGRLMQGTQYTIVQLNDTIARLERVSASDELTGAYNRRAGEKRLDEECARADRDKETFHLAFFDINRFKTVNDTHGHAMGDVCLAHLARVLHENTRRGDWVARWGGDEFVVGLHRNHAIRMVIDRILQAIEETPCASGDNLVTLAVSCGVAEYRFGTRAQGAVSDADHAMYRAKARSRREPGNHVSYWNEALEKGLVEREDAVGALDRG